MQDILQQIQSLKEDFMNLIEVEGLGQPASDVPPSTNKIKKDRKTKNGKVELVSVEDELFPYDGNKREQYRQKILDTINGMIQGTATLEDLLQIVRQKKAPLKEAMELMEDILGTIDKKYAKKGSYDKHGELYSKALDNQSKEQDAAREREYYVKDWYGKDQTKNQKGELKTYLRKVKQLQDRQDRLEKQGDFSEEGDTIATDKAIKRHNRKAALKEAVDLEKFEVAMGILEEMIGEGRNLQDVVIRGYKKGRVSKLPGDYQKLLNKAYEIPSDASYFHLSKGEKGAIKTRINQIAQRQFSAKESLDDQIEKKFKKGEISFKKAAELSKKIESMMSPAKNQQEIKNAYEKDAKTNPNSVLRDIDKTAYFKSIKRARKKGKISRPATRYKDGYQFPGDPTPIRAPQTENIVFPSRNESLEEALSLIESIHTAIEKGAHEIKKPMLHAKAIMNHSNELQNAAKKELPKNKKNSFKAINDKMNEIAKKRGITPVDDYVNGNKLEEALELMEDLYATIKSRHGEPKYEGPDSHPANKSAELIYKMDDVRGKEYNQAKERDEGINLYNKRFQTKNKRGERETKYRSSKYKSFSDYWRPYKTDKDKIEGSIRRHASKLEEALRIIEGLCINDGRKDFFQHDVAGIGGTGVDAIRKITKQTFGRTKKV